VRRALGPAVGALVLSAAAVGAGQGRPAPLLDVRDRATEYLGPGRELAPPAGLEEIRFAFFGPADPGHPDWGDAWRGAALGVEGANAETGADPPFRLVAAWSDSPWGSGVADLVKLVYRQGVWGVLGGVDGTTTHLAEQVAVKARLTLVSPGATDPSVNETSVPWMFTLLPADDRIAEVLAGAALTEPEPWAVVTTADRDAAMAWRALRAVRARRRARAPVQHLALPCGMTDYRQAVGEVARGEPRGIVVLAGAVDSAAIVTALRSQGFAGRIVGGASFGRRVFRDRAGRDAEGVAFPLLFDAERPEAGDLVRRYERRWGESPDFLAAHAYDGVRLLIAAFRGAGANRALIRDELVTLAPWPGATGLVSWDATGRNVRPLAMGTWRGGRACSAEPAGEREGSHRGRGPAVVRHSLTTASAPPVLGHRTAVGPGDRGRSGGTPRSRRRGTLPAGRSRRAPSTRSGSLRSGTAAGRRRRRVRR
jgi:ABC-type branched-subunit amino acid transport system substrate-binding protein